MNTPRIHRYVLSLLSAFVAFAAPGFLPAQPEIAPLSGSAKKNHTITVSYTNGAWNYSIYPAQPDPKKAKVKRGDTVSWVCADGSWQVFFKNDATPLVDPHGNPMFTIDGAGGAANGGEVGAKAKDGDSFTYGVRVHLSGGGTVVDDPEIIIDSDER